MTLRDFGGANWPRGLHVRRFMRSKGRSTPIFIAQQIIITLARLLSEGTTVVAVVRGIAWWLVRIRHWIGPTIIRPASFLRKLQMRTRTTLAKLGIGHLAGCRHEASTQYRFIVEIMVVNVGLEWLLFRWVVVAQERASIASTLCKLWRIEQIMIRPWPLILPITWSSVCIRLRYFWLVDVPIINSVNSWYAQITAVPLQEGICWILSEEWRLFITV